MTYLSSSAFRLVRETMIKWPKFSGDTDYPVPSVTEGRYPRQEYHDCIESMWDKNTAYGLLRWELLDWLIEQPELNVRLYKMRSSENVRPILTDKRSEG